MIELYFIGIGMGNFDYFIMQVICVMNVVDFILLLCKGEVKFDFIDLCYIICVVVLMWLVCLVEFDLLVCEVGGDYLDGVNDWYDVIVWIWVVQIVCYFFDGGRLVLFVWGDLLFYDSSLCIVDWFKGIGFVVWVEVVLGIISLQVLMVVYVILLNNLGVLVIVIIG